jgi:hypothetical protein
MKVDYSILPEHMREGTKLYIDRGIMTGSFLTAVMENNLVEAFAQADHINTHAMRNWAQFLYSEAPTPCWGSKKAVSEWKQIGGLKGFYAQSPPAEYIGHRLESGNMIVCEDCAIKEEIAEPSEGITREMADQEPLFCEVCKKQL